MSDGFSTLQIGYIVASETQPVSGTERYYFDLLRELTSAGVRSFGLVLGELQTRKTQSSYVESFAPQSGISPVTRIKQLRAAVRRIIGNADLVVSHSAEHAFPVLDIVGNKCLVVHFQGPRALEYIAEGKNLKRIALAFTAELITFARADRFIVLSQSFANILCRHYFVSKKRIHVVPGAVDVERFRPILSRTEARARLGWPQDRPIALAVRRLAPTKGLDHLVDAIAIVKERVPGVFAVLVGGGPLRDELEKRVDSLNLRDNVRFEGLLEEELLPHAYAAADVSIVPTVELEGFGLSVVESLACGTPALVTPVGGLPEVVRALDPGLIMDGFTPQDLALGLTRALSAPDALPSKAACVEFVRRYSWSSVAGTVKEVYAEALAAKLRAPKYSSFIPLRLRPPASKL